MRFVLCRVDCLWCAIPLTHVVEVMRPRPLVALTDAPDFVMGLSTIRGLMVPVIDLGMLMLGRRATPSRLVLLKVLPQRAAVAVDAVVNVVELGPDTLEPLPSLLGAATHERVSALSLRDERVLAVLEATRLLPTHFSGAQATGNA